VQPAKVTGKTPDTTVSQSIPQNVARPESVDRAVPLGRVAESFLTPAQPEPKKDVVPALAEERNDQRQLKESTIPAKYASPEVRPEVHGRVAAPGLQEAKQALPVAAQVAGEILSRAEVTTRDGQTHFHMQLNPPDLGSVRIHLTASEQGITARLFVHEESARQLLQSQLESLRQRLANAGVTLGKCDVSRDGSDSQTPQQQRPARAVTGPVDSASAQAQETQSTLSSGAGRINVLV
jgi:flagellar hook-length control protein FliK